MSQQLSILEIIGSLEMNFPKIYQIFHPIKADVTVVDVYMSKSVK
jgi:hypothetical protein